MTLKDVTSVCQHATEFGLSHSCMFRPLGDDQCIIRITLFHESGESIWSEVSFSTNFKNARSQEQAFGSAKTYYHKYMLSGIYGLANSDDEDDGEATVQDASEIPAQKPKTPSRPIENAKPKNELTASEQESCLEYCANKTLAQNFLDHFYPGFKGKRSASLFCKKAHLEWLEKEAVSLEQPSALIPD